MQQQKLVYEAPQADALVIRVEGSIMYISGGTPGSAGQDMIPGNSYGFGDDD